MKEHNTFPGSVYAVTCKDGCAVTDASGELNMYCEAGGQLHVTAPSDKLYTSAEASVRKVNFKQALAALSLLGGGDTLPAGYIRAEFFESTGTQYVVTDFVPNNESGILLKSYLTISNDTIPCGCRNSASTATRFYAVRSSRVVSNVSSYKNGYGWGAWILFSTITGTYTDTTYLNWLNDRFAKCKVGQQNLSSLPFKPEYPLYLFAANIAGKAESLFQGRIWTVAFSQGSEIVRSFVPVLTPFGTPCMWEKKSNQPFTNDGTGSFIVGLTLTQARNLRKLPAGGGELTISLPSNWQEDAGVVAALATAESKGWVLTIQTYEAEAGAVSTFALRRIWVRKRAEPNGSYVAADGTRWQIDWCATMVGGDPQEHGYEPFRSVAAAAAYWELELYVDPETEQLLTD